jgi:hypothetical protein
VRTTSVTMTKTMKPSQIFYSQDTINNYFDGGVKIGKTLDDICTGSCSIAHIPTIGVCQHDGRWYTGDNRRLWLFRQLEKLGRCSTIEVNEISSIPDNKFTTKNGGVEITVRGNPESSYARDVVWESRRKLGILPKYVRPG